jgi:[methyl-Co(III) methanol-specific corrinoid protein]:coenzyme M methyltransferase
MRRWHDTIAELAEGDLPVVGQVWGPLTTASARVGHDRMFSLLMRDSTEADRVLELEVRTVQALARAAVGAGASIVWVAEPMAVPIDPRHFEQHALLPLHRVVADVCARGRDTVIHMSGKADHLVSLVSATGALGMSITAGTDLARARDSVPPGFVLFGNLDAEELEQRDARELGERARGMAATMTGAPFVATPGSHLPDDVPVARMAAFVDEARDHPGLARTL